ncbi:MAG: helix-turn-helix domain-containing protein [Caldilineaceae bacterium]|nr:helix-turn-helix domain-containing protein [Caldilineaceae bacterium]
MRVLSTTEVAQELQVSRDTVVRLIQIGELPAERLSSTGHRRVREEDLFEYAKRKGIKLLSERK